MKDSGELREGSAARWVIYEDEGVRDILPFTWLRPASDLLLGTWTGRRRLERATRPGRPEHVAGVGQPENATAGRILEVCRDYLVPLGKGRIAWRDASPRSAGCGDDAPGPSLWNGGAVWISSRVVPDAHVIESLAGLDEDCVAVSDGGPIAFRPGSRMVSRVREHMSAAGEPDYRHGQGSAASASSGALQGLESGGEVTSDSCASILGELLRGDWPALSVRARVVSGLADLVRFQESLLEEDLRVLLDELPPPVRAGDGHACRLEDVRLGDGCVVDPGAVLDAREGPVVLGPGCHVFPHTWLRGPLYAGENCLFLGGRIGTGSSLGPVCRVRGEVEATVMLGYCNKAHDGFIGHSYLGEWINLGAMTTNSDLKNNYSVFRIEPYGRVETTGLNKVGAFLADHVKTRIGCLLGGGTTVGVGTNLVGEPAVPGRWIPDFTWGSGPGAAEYDIDRFLETAQVVYGRRQVPWTSAAGSALRIVHEATRAARAAFNRGAGRA